MAERTLDDKPDRLTQNSYKFNVRIKKNILKKKYEIWKLEHF